MNKHHFILLLATVLLAGTQKVVLHMAGNQKAEYSTQLLVH